jgi:NTE family protein
MLVLSAQRWTLVTAMLLLTPCIPADAADRSCDLDASGRPRVGLVLSGGGARGIAHIGVIRLLEELHIPVDYVAGTSMGAVVGGMLATGMTAAELTSVVESIDWVDIFADGTARAERPFRRKRDDDLSLFGPKFGVGPNSSLLPRGAINGQKVAFLFESVTGPRSRANDFDALPIPFRAVAADIGTGEAVVMGQGNLATAMRASMSIPGVFKPVAWNGHQLVDGGIANNLPVDVVKSMGADVVIAVDVGTPLTPGDELEDFVSITNQLTSILVQRNTIEQRAGLEADDVLIVPALGTEITSAGFEKATREAIPIGYAAAAQASTALASLAVDEARYQEHRSAVAACVEPPPTVDFVRVENRSRFKDGIVEERISSRPGKPLSVERMDGDIKRIYALGFLDTATYDVIEEDGRTGVVVDVEQDARGTQFIETGLTFVGDSDSSAIDVRLGYLWTDVDDRGSEFRTLFQVGENQGLLVELYKALDDDLRFILLPSLTAQRRSFDVFDEGGSRFARAQIEEAGGSLAIGREFGRHAAVFAGARRLTGNAHVEIGPPASSTSFDTGEYFFNATWDRLDNRYFPGNGTSAFFEYIWSDSSLGASSDSEQIEFSSLTARTFDRHTVFGSLLYGTTVSGNAPIQSFFSAGGPLRLSGLEPDQLTDQHVGVALLGYRMRLTSQGFLPPYAGLSVEYGTAASRRHDLLDEGILNGSVYFGFDSPLGPLYAGYGLAEGGHRAYFLRIGALVGANPRFGLTGSR